MYLCQDILQHSIVPALEPLDLVSFSMTSTLFHEIVADYVSKMVIRRVNVVLEKFFGSDVDKWKQFMNDTGVFMSGEIMLQCVLDEYWWDKKCDMKYIHFYNEITKLIQPYILRRGLEKFAKKCGFKDDTRFTRAAHIYVKGDKYMYMFCEMPGYSDNWLDNYKSKYYVQDNVEKVEIVPSYGSLIGKIVNYDPNKYCGNILDNLCLLKDNGFKLNIDPDQIYDIINRYCDSQLIQVSFIGYTILDDNKMVYSYECKNTSRWDLNHDYYGRPMSISGNIISFVI